MFKKTLLLIIVFYFLTLMQTSFLVHFALWGITLNIVLIFVILLNLFEKTEGKQGFYGAFAAGFFSDIFSSQFIGFNILFFLLAAIFIKFVIKKYVRIPSLGKI